MSAVMLSFIPVTLSLTVLAVYFNVVCMTSPLKLPDLLSFLSVTRNRIVCRCLHAVLDPFLFLFLSVHDTNRLSSFCICRVRKQIVNVPSFIVRLDSQKHIDFALTSPFGGGRQGRVKRKNQRKAEARGEESEEEEED